MSIFSVITEELQHELDEARSEIARHHELIAKLRDGLRWAFERVPYPQYTAEYLADNVEHDRQRYAVIKELLNREIG